MRRSAFNPAGLRPYSTQIRRSLGSGRIRTAGKRGGVKRATAPRASYLRIEAPTSVPAAACCQAVWRRPHPLWWLRQHRDVPPRGRRPVASRSPRLRDWPDLPDRLRRRRRHRLRCRASNCDGSNSSNRRTQDSDRLPPDSMPKCHALRDSFQAMNPEHDRVEIWLGQVAALGFHDDLTVNAVLKDTTWRTRPTGWCDAAQALPRTLSPTRCSRSLIAFTRSEVSEEFPPGVQIHLSGECG